MLIGQFPTSGSFSLLRLCITLLYLYANMTRCLCLYLLC